MTGTPDAANGLNEPKTDLLILRCVRLQRENCSNLYAAARREIRTFMPAAA